MDKKEFKILKNMIDIDAEASGQPFQYRVLE